MLTCTVVFVLGRNWPYLAVVKHVNKWIEWTYYYYYYYNSVETKSLLHLIHRCQIVYSYTYGQTTWRVRDRYERLVTVAAEVLATPCWKHLSQVSVLCSSRVHSVSHVNVLFVLRFRSTDKDFLYPSGSLFDVKCVLNDYSLSQIRWQAVKTNSPLLPLLLKHVVEMLLSVLQTYAAITLILPLLLKCSLFLQTVVLNTHEQTVIDKCDLTKITATSHTTKERMFSV
jgi:hypothetical protein